MPEDSFPLFPRFPAEIRIAIWYEALSATLEQSLVGYFDWRWTHRDKAKVIKTTQGNVTLQPHRRVQMPLPAVPCVSHEAHDAFRVWARAGGFSCQRNAAQGGGKEALCRPWAPERDLVYLGRDRKDTVMDMVDVVLESDDDDLEEGGGETPARAAQVFEDMQFIVIPAFTAYYSVRYVVSLIRAARVRKVYVLWGPLPQPSHVRGHEDTTLASSEDEEEDDEEEEDEGEGEGEYEWESDVQPCWRLEPLSSQCQGEVEMHCWVPDAGGGETLKIEKMDMEEELDEWYEALLHEYWTIDEPDDGDTGMPWAREFLEMFVHVRLLEGGKHWEGNALRVGGS